MILPYANAEGEPCAPVEGAESSGASAESSPADHQAALLAIRQARDMVLAKNRELIDKLSQAEDQIAELSMERDDLKVERTESLLQLAELTHANTDLQNQLGAAVRERDEALAAVLSGLPAPPRVGAPSTPQWTASDEALATALSEAERQLAAAQSEREQASAGHAEEVAALNSRLESLQRECDLARQEAESRRGEVEGQQAAHAEEKAALSARITLLETQKAASPAPTKTVSRLPPPPPPPAVKPATPKALPAKAAPAPAVPARAAPAKAEPVKATPAKTEPPRSELLSDQKLRDAVGTIRRAMEQMVAQPAQTEFLADLEAKLRDLAQQSADGGLEVIRHLSALGAEVAARTQAAPAKQEATLPLIVHTVDMLGWLALRGRAEMIDIAGALVYAVDDDVDSCECVATALERVGILTKYSVRSDIALEQIAANRSELIVLDVDMPGLDGFELRARIRALPGGALTPIVFLSGHANTSDRFAGLSDDRCQFVAKPYHLSELTLRILATVVEARLG